MVAVSRHKSVDTLRGSVRCADLFCAKLKCSACGAKPALVYLVAGSARTFCYGPPPT
jgi:hypothetical protein